jgi:hypothetical protein
MKLDSQHFYNGYRSVLEGQKRICTQKWVKHVYEQIEKEKKNELRRANTTP